MEKTIKESTEIYLSYINNNYSSIKNKLFKYCQQKMMPFREDDYQQTILDIYNSIEKGNFKKELTPSNIDNYLFISFRNLAAKHLKGKTHLSLDTPIDEDRKLLDVLSEEIDDYDYEEQEELENSEIIKINKLLEIIKEQFNQERVIIYKRFLRGEKFKDITLDIPNARGKYLETLYWLKDNNYNLKQLINETTN